MNPKLASTAKRGVPPAGLPKLPDPPERHEAELPSRPEEKLLPAGRRFPLLLGLLLLAAVLILLILLL